MDEFLPATFRMDVKAEREAFFAQQEGERHTFAHINRSRILMQRQQRPTGLTGSVFGLWASTF